MNGETLTAVFSLFGSLIGTFGGIIAGAKLMNYRIEQLEKQVEKHNNVIDRVYKLERDKAVFEEDLKVANHRIGDLEEYHKRGGKVNV